jgi:hypothetical protein
VPTSAKKKAKPEPGPDDLVRQEAGNYLSGDGRFEVRQSDANWYLVDREQANEFGQELIHGPYGSMRDAKQALPGSRDITPLLRSRARPKKPSAKKPTASATTATAAKLKLPPASWVDRLPKTEQVEVRALIRALEREGVEDPEALVRKDRQGLMPVVATTLIGKRLDAVVAKLPEKDQALARKLIGQLGAVVTSGEKLPDPLPGWALFETGEGREPTRRRVRVGG